jgi:uncharacterized repeat protein (TIGR01451 family)
VVVAVVVRMLVVGVSAFAGAVGWAAEAGPAVAATEPAPSPIHVDVSPDISEPKSGDVVTYVVRVQNGSATDYPHLSVFQLLPSGFRVTAAIPKAKVDRGGPEWTADVPAGSTAVFSVTATAGSVAEVEQSAGPAADPVGPTADHTADHHQAAARRRPDSGPTGDGQQQGSVTSSARPTAVPAATFVTTACARAAGFGPALACGSAKQTLSDSAEGSNTSTQWRPGLLGLGFLAVLAAGFQAIVRRSRRRNAESAEAE